jgi:hypothetical protein
MIKNRMNEAAIDARLDECIRGAHSGDVGQARELHDILDAMLTERDTPEGRLWLTDHGRQFLARMHRDLSHCEGAGPRLADAVLAAVRLNPHPAHWDDTCSFIRDLRLAITVANEMCEQREAGSNPDVARAAETVAKGGEFGPNPEYIRHVYDEIAATVTGFRDIAHC